ncbi:hypothetical protein E0H82_02495 [Acinetobacter sp. ANC 4910]|uniref:hypothetical protein n=1 Tax=Acinetobacter sp. ANC 4910 TaxID=2529850 RepID=UPI0010387CF8|nr:hypothetical protein [Acinetobacter sp. ANC 4910]TCB37495.1 hypothetical protein E0H82_02495 [Acinetobacter sp. ANC 4910]
MSAIILIVYNILFFATFACLIKPSLLANFIGREPLPRWIFAVALVIIVSMKPNSHEPEKDDAKIQTATQNLATTVEVTAAEAAPISVEAAEIKQ